MATHLHETAPEPLAEALVYTLESERAVLQLLDDDFQRQREAIRRHDFEAIEEATQRTNEHVARLETLRKTRQRQAKLLARVLELPGEDVRVAQITERLGGSLPLSVRLERLRDDIRIRADAAQAKIDEVAYMLQRSSAPGTDSPRTMHRLETPYVGDYKSSGRSNGAPQAGMFNRLGS